MFDDEEGGFDEPEAVEAEGLPSLLNMCVVFTLLLESVVDRLGRLCSIVGSRCLFI